MAYTTEQMAKKLKAAREAKGLSQRALAKLADVPQSHISKIENGAVDLRVSSLVEIARALDLDIALVPRKALPAVQSIVRSSAPPIDTKAMQAAMKEYQKIQDSLKLALEENPAVKEIAQLQRQVRELQRLKVLAPDMNSIRQANKAVLNFTKHTEDTDNLREALATVRSLRNAAVHALPTPEPVKPAYSLDDDNG